MYETLSIATGFLRTTKESNLCEDISVVKWYQISIVSFSSSHKSWSGGPMVSNLNILNNKENKHILTIISSPYSGYSRAPSNYATATPYYPPSTSTTDSQLWSSATTGLSEYSTKGGLPTFEGFRSPNFVSSVKNSNYSGMYNSQVSKPSHTKRPKIKSIYFLTAWLVDGRIRINVKWNSTWTCQFHRESYCRLVAFIFLYSFPSM